MRNPCERAREGYEKNCRWLIEHESGEEDAKAYEEAGDDLIVHGGNSLICSNVHFPDGMSRGIYGVLSGG